MISLSFYQVLKLIDNDELDLTKIDAIKDDVEYYIEVSIVCIVDTSLENVYTL